MSGLTLLVVLLGAAGIVLAAFLYLRQELPVPGRGLLLALRLGVIVLVVLLLLDVHLPGNDDAGIPGEGGRWVLLDPDLSLVLPSDGPGSLWDEAVSFAEEAAGRGARLALATPGLRGPEGTEVAALRGREPDHPPGDLVEGVARLGEAGADSVILLSTFRRSPELLELLAAETPVPLRLERLGGEVRNTGIADFSFPARLPAGEPFEARVSIFGEGGSPGDSVDVEIRAGGELLEAVRLPLPEPGTEASFEVLLLPPADSGLVRFTASTTLDGDAFAPDDARARWARVGEGEEGILLVSLRPDWEPRHLLPVLKAVTGLDGAGFLRLGDDRFLSLAEGSEVPIVIGSAQLRDRLPGARLLVVHGAGGPAPEWLEAAVREHPRVLHLPADASGAALAGVPATAAAAGEWVPDPDIPPSPVSPFLSGIRVGGLPPLSSVLVAQAPEARPVLGAQGPRVGDAASVVLLLDSEGGRRGLALAQGFWRWGSREGEARDAYRALWSGVAGWLLAQSGSRVAEGVRPMETVQPRGEPLRWEVAPEARGAEVVLTAGFLPGEAAPPGSAEPAQPTGDPTPLFRGTLEPGDDGVATTAPVPPGIYRYEARAAESGGGDSLLAEGWVEVERWAPSLRYPPLRGAEGTLSAASGIATAGASGGRPLRTHPLPYLLVLLFLCAEWIGRRRAGLR